MAEIGQNDEQGVRDDDWGAVAVAASDLGEPQPEFGESSPSGEASDFASAASLTNGDPPSWMLWGVDEEA